MRLAVSLLLAVAFVAVMAAGEGGRSSRNKRFIDFNSLRGWMPPLTTKIAHHRAVPEPYKDEPLADLMAEKDAQHMVWGPEWKDYSTLLKDELKTIRRRLDCLMELRDADKCRVV